MIRKRKVQEGDNMFGYVTINKPELKIREFERYQGYYCGICRSLRKRYGISGQITLSYDMVFLAALRIFCIP